MQFDFMYRKDMKSNSNKGNSEKKILTGKNKRHFSLIGTPWEQKMLMGNSWRNVCLKDLLGIRFHISKVRGNRFDGKYVHENQFFGVDINRIEFREGKFVEAFFILVEPLETEFRNGKHKGTNYIQSKLMKIIFINNMSWN